MESQVFQPDEIDWHILECLQEDARVSYAEIGRRVNLSSTAVAERMRRMEDVGIIRGYTVLLNHELLGRPITAFIRLALDGDIVEPEDMTTYARKLPEIQELYTTIGTESYLFKVVVRSISDLDVLLKKLRRFGKTSTSIVLAHLLTGQVIDNTVSS